MRQEAESESVAREVAGRILGMRKAGETDAEFARRLGITPQLLNHYKKGGGASVEAVARITKNDPRAYWLLTGETQPEHASLEDPGGPINGEWVEMMMGVVRCAGGDQPLTPEERRRVQIDVLRGIVKLGGPSGHEVQPFTELLQRLESEAREAAPAPSRAFDPLTFLEQESRAAEYRAAAAIEWGKAAHEAAVAARIEAEEGRERRLRISYPAVDSEAAAAVAQSQIARGVTRPPSSTAAPPLPQPPARAPKGSASKQVDQ